GSFGMRSLVTERLAANGLKPGDVTDLILTHSHYDHSVNWTLFQHARIVIGRQELSWSLNEPWGETPVPELYVEKLENWPTLETIEDGDDPIPGVRAYLAPGHTPGCLVYVLSGTERNIIFTGDAAKNRTELVSGTTDMTYDPVISKASIDLIWNLWRKRPGTILVPGHDVPLTQENDVVRKINKNEAAIRSWFGDELETTTLFNLSTE
ncbi:MAG: MBL fold metallo-hydrolase, partial [Desulfobulbia bacterium]